MNVHEVTELLPSRFGQVRSVEEIQVGLSGAEVYGVATDAGDYVLRIVPMMDPGVWARELVVRRLTSDAGIAPALEWVDEARGATLMQRIGGRGFTSALADPTERARALEGVARVLAKLHALPGEGLVPMDPVTVARATWRAQCERPGFPAWAEPAFAHLERAAQLLADDDRRTPSHNDPNPANVLWDGERAWLVDWEQSGLTHPYYDVAALSTLLIMDDEGGLQLLTTQEGAPLSAQQAEAFVALRRVATVFYGTIFFSLAAKLVGTVPSAIDDVPSMAEFYARLGSGALSLRTPDGQAMFGAVMLKRAVLAL
jgi:Ser/Thr protein kinase RdoA (MazF antagonist)